MEGMTKKMGPAFDGTMDAPVIGGFQIERLPDEGEEWTPLAERKGTGEGEKKMHKLEEIGEMGLPTATVVRSLAKVVTEVSEQVGVEPEELARVVYRLCREANRSARKVQKQCEWLESRRGRVQS